MDRITTHDPEEDALRIELDRVTILSQWDQSHEARRMELEIELAAWRAKAELRRE